MKNFCSVAFTTLAIAILATTRISGYQEDQATAKPTETAQQSATESTSPTTTKSQTEKLAEQANGKIRFTFSEQDWSDVIPWFSNQANFSLQPVADYPEGVFTLKDDSEYTVLEALDQLNHALMIRQPEPYTLIRNRNMLVLWKLRDADFPNDLIETVKVEDLDKRGKHETISCVFDMGGLIADDIAEQMEPLISSTNRNYLAVFPTANQIHVRETGGQLRKIRDMIQASLNKEFGDEMDLKTYNLKYLDAEAFMGLARGLLGMRDDRNQRDDEKLLISVEPFAERLFVRGNSKWLAEFDKVAKTIDAAPEKIVDGVVLDAPTVERHPVLSDPKLAFDALQTMLESRDDVRMQQDEITGTIIVLGRKEDHKLVADTLATISGSAGDGFEMIQLVNGDPAEIITVLQNLFRQSAEETSGPVLLANSYTRQIIVRGTPQEVETVKMMVAKLDANSVVTELGPRTRTRIIPMGEREMEELAPLLPDLLMSVGRDNPFNMIMPEDRKDVKNSIKKQQTGDTVEDFLQGRGIPPTQKPDQSRRHSPGRFKTSDARQLKSTLASAMSLAACAIGANPTLTSSFVTFQETQEPLETAEQQVGSSYQPAPEIKSVPGAPIVGRFSSGSLILDSEDLDALDDLVYEIENRVKDSSEVQRPTFFFLKYRGADEVIAFVENFYGISEGGGGGGGGGLMEGMMSNMMGGGDDLLSGLLGGGTGGSTGSSELDGDVRFGVDMTFNSLWVAGATDNDLDEIAILIDQLDQPEAPHDPKLMGEFRTIDIIHRDPMEVKEIIEPMLSELLASNEPRQGGGGQNNEAQQMMKMVQQISGNGKRGGGGGVSMEEEKPKARLGLDMATRQLLVFGPEFIYKDILTMVIELDKPELSSPKTLKIMPNVNNQQAVVNALRQMYGNKIVIVDKDSGEAVTVSGSTTEGSSTTNTSQSAAQKQSEAARSALLNAVRAQQARPQQARSSNANAKGRGAGGGAGGGGARGGGARGGR